MYSFSKKFFLLVGLVASVGAFTLFSSANTASAMTTAVNWQAEGGSTNFNNNTILFTGFMTSGLDSINGSGYTHNHGNQNETMAMSFLLDNVWTNVFGAAVTGNNSPNLLSAIPTPIMFANAMISGIRLTSSIGVNQTYHGMYKDVNFNFKPALSVVPLPAALPLYGAGMLVLGLIGWRRKRNA
jgi:hypothetical protein